MKNRFARQRASVARPSGPEAGAPEVRSSTLADPSPANGVVGSGHRIDVSAAAPAGILLLFLASVSIPWPAAAAPDSASNLTAHPIWSEPDLLDTQQRELVESRVAVDDERDLAALLDFLYEARSPVAAGRHSAALRAVLGLPRRKRRSLLRFIEQWAEEAERLRESGDLDALRQLQTRVSITTAELAGRRDDLEKRDSRGPALRDVQLLCKFTEESIWARHALNPLLRGPLRQATAPADRAVDRYYRRRQSRSMDSSSRAAYLKLLADFEGGGFDAVNAYDEGGISLGIAQFTAASSHLGQLLARVRRQKPKLFRRRLGRHGLEVDSQGWLYFEQRPLIAAIRSMDRQEEFNSVLLVFIRALESQRLSTALASQQLSLADELIDRAMSLDTGDGRRADELLTSARGHYHLADAYINTGAGNTLEVLATAREDAAVGEDLTAAFVAARQAYYRGIEQSHQASRIERIDAVFGK